MTLERLAEYGDRAGADAVERTRDRLVASADLPPGVAIAVSSAGIVLSGKRLRRRYLTDVNLRNFAR
jgi:hypothetical protein